MFTERTFIKLALLWVFCAIFAMRCAFLCTQLRSLENDPDNYIEIARGLQQHQKFEMSGSSPTQFKAFRPPLYPLLLSSFLPAEDSSNVRLAIAAVHLTLGMLTAWLTLLTAKRFGIPRIWAIFATLFVGLDPLLLQQSTIAMTETLATFLAVFTLSMLARMENWRPRHWRAVTAGMCLALCVLCRPSFLIWAIAVTLASLFIDLRRKAFDQTLGIVIGMALLLTPWAVRNYELLGRPILTTTHGGSTFYRANNKLFYEHLRTNPRGTVWNSGEAFDDACRRATAGASYELEADRKLYQAAWDDIRAQPGMFAVATLLRVTRLWGIVPAQTNPHESNRMRLVRYAIGCGYAMEFALAIVGVIALGRRIFQPPWLWGLLLVLSFTAVHAFYWTDMRMRAPLVPVVALAAAVGLGRVVDWWRGRC